MPHIFMPLSVSRRSKRFASERSGAGVDVLSQLERPAAPPGRRPVHRRPVTASYWPGPAEADGNQPRGGRPSFPQPRGQGDHMIVSVFVRRLKPGATFQDFVREWEADEGFGVPTRVFNAQSLTDPREVISIGFV